MSVSVSGAAEPGGGKGESRSRMSVPGTGASWLGIRMSVPGSGATEPGGRVEQIISRVALV